MTSLPLDQIRDLYAGPGMTRVRAKGADIVFYVAREGKPRAVCFEGRSAKPKWHYTFRSAEARDARIAAAIADRQARERRVAEQRVARKAFAHTLKVGDVLVASWGYEQTNVDYFVVVKTTAKTVDLQECGARTVPEVHGGASRERVAPDPDRRFGPVFRRTPSEGNIVMIESYKSAHPWNGHADYRTASGWGH
jgi:hypothetical protein